MPTHSSNEWISAQVQISCQTADVTCGEREREKELLPAPPLCVRKNCYVYKNLKSIYNVHTFCSLQKSLSELRHKFNNKEKFVIRKIGSGYAFLNSAPSRLLLLPHDETQSISAVRMLRAGRITRCSLSPNSFNGGPRGFARA